MSQRTAATSTHWRSPSPVEHRPLPPDDLVRRKPDITLAGELLGWAPTVPLDEGLAPVVEYFRETLGIEG